MVMMPMMQASIPKTTLVMVSPAAVVEKGVWGEKVPLKTLLGRGVMLYMKEVVCIYVKLYR